jgi:PHD/YefM family antitoxin component YafN of YafNO toxin-antitoxin module
MKKMNKAISTRKVIQLLCIAVICSMISCIFPIERPFVRFDSPQKAFEYTFNANDLLKIVQDEDMAVAIYNNNGGTSFVLLDKDDRGWKMNTSNADDIQISSIDMFRIIAARSSSHSKLMIFVQSSSYDQKDNIWPRVSDSCGSKFQEFDYRFSESTFKYFYTVVTTPATNYSISINGKSAVISTIMSSQINKENHLLLGSIISFLGLLILALLTFQFRFGKKHKI